MVYTYYRDGREFYREDRQKGTILKVEVSEDESHATSGVTAPSSVPDSAEEVPSIPGCVREAFGQETRMM